MLKIRLARRGRKKSPCYVVVVAEESAPRDGRFIEIVGRYNPMLSSDSAERTVFVKERINYWIHNGARPSERVATLLNRSLNESKIDLDADTAKIIKKCLPKFKINKAKESQQEG